VLAIGRWPVDRSRLEARLMRLYVDDDKCQGHTLCAWAAPDVVRLGDDDGHAIVDEPRVPPEHEEAVRRAVLNCPEGALRIDDD
jgi:ferredoxin